MMSVRPRATSVFGVCAGLLLAAAPSHAQTALTLEDAMRRAQGDTSEARALAAAIDETDARIRRARARGC